MNRAESLCGISALLVLRLLLGTVGAQPVPQDHPKTVVARRVVDDLVRAIGDGRTPPEFQLLASGASNRMKVAWFAPKQNLLTLEERAYDLCAALGPDSLNALAVLLGHELAHYYKDHGWVGDFGNAFAQLEVGQTLNRLRRSEEQIEALETEADIFGGFFGYVAGYNTLEIAPSLLEKLYAAYNLSTQLRGYPALPERQEIARQSAAKLRGLVPVFEAGHRLLLVRQYRDAAHCFDFIARTFPSREILNNAGVARALEALELFAPDDLHFAYPFEQDAATRLLHGGQTVRSGSAASAAQRRKQLLQEAATRFEQACTRDTAYAPARVNLACVADLQGRHREALTHAYRAVELAEQSGGSASLADALIARGIARTHADPPDRTAARQDFEQARQGNQPLAQLNLAALDPGPGVRPTDITRGDERISFSESVFAPDSPAYQAIVDAPDASARVQGSGASPMRIYARRTWQGYGLVVDTGNSSVAFLEEKTPQGRRTGQRIGVGSSLTEVRQAYGHPARSLAGRQGTYSVYEKNRLIFHADPTGRVIVWMQYDIEKRLYDTPTEPALPPKPAERRVALVIGNGGYTSGALRNAVNDARSMAQALAECGFEVVEKLDADRQTMFQAVREFGSALRQGGVGLFYYAGHGVQVEGHNYLIPVGADVQREEDVEAQCLLAAHVLKRMESANSRVNIVVLDACRNNPFPSQYRSQGQGLAMMDAAKGSILIYATGPGQVAVDQGEGDNGLFTSKLLKHMQTPELEFEDLFKKVGQEVETVSGDRQRPWISKNFYGDFYFLPPADWQPASDQQPASAMGFLSTQLPPNVRGGELVPVADFGFYIDKYEVTSAEFAAFLNAEGNQIEGDALWLDVEDEDAPLSYQDGRYIPAAGRENHPVVAVTWHGAMRYCEWAGKRLPTREEWRQAALGIDGRQYPWGNQPPDANGLYRANFYQDAPASDGYEKTAPVGTFPAGASPYGALDMAGNVWEWVDAAEGGLHLVEGGSWENDSTYLDSSTLMDPSYAMGHVGFRCARSR